MTGKLALEDGSVFSGTAVGATGTRTGEVVFNTAMTGYQEVFTDPSYCGQIVTMTFPLQGNYGVNPEDFESAHPYLSGVVLKELPRRPSNFRATDALPDFLAAHGVIGLVGVDTRALTRRIRVHGALRGVVSTEISDEIQLFSLAQSAPPMIGANLVREVARDGTEAWSEPRCGTADGPRAQRGPKCHVVVIDCGIKQSILRGLADGDCRVTIVPAGAAPAEILDLATDGLVVGNGPGDPAAVKDTVETLRGLLGRLPILGICLGHQLLALALGAKTYKLTFGHHGANLPVLNRPAGRVEITSQNHGFAVDASSIERVGGTVTHVNLNDASVEGFIHRDQGVLAVQFHPEASPGPHDARYILQRFAQTVAQHRSPDVDVWASPSQARPEGSGHDGRVPSR